MTESLQHLSLVRTVRHDVDVMVPRDDPVMSKRADEGAHGHDVRHVRTVHGVIECVERVIEDLMVTHVPGKEFPLDGEDVWENPQEEDTVHEQENQEDDEEDDHSLLFDVLPC